MICRSWVILAIPARRRSCAGGTGGDEPLAEGGGRELVVPCDAGSPVMALLLSRVGAGRRNLDWFPLLTLAPSLDWPLSSGVSINIHLNLKTSSRILEMMIRPGSVALGLPDLPTVPAPVLAHCGSGGGGRQRRHVFPGRRQGVQIQRGHVRRSCRVHVDSRGRFARDYSGERDLPAGRGQYEGSHYALSHIRAAKIRSGQDVLVYGATGSSPRCVAARRSCSPFRNMISR
jgi:hypothetical protein